MVKGEQEPRSIDLLFSRHGPMFYMDATHHRAYVLRSAFSEPGTASYLASLKLDQAKTCKEFLDLAVAWKANSENLICGDVDGNIGFQASGYAPKRTGWLGRLPVPGTGEYEWDGPRTELPREYNPARGFIATANHNINTARLLAAGRVQDDEHAAVRSHHAHPAGDQARADVRRWTESQTLQRDVYSLRGSRSDQKLFRGWTARRCRPSNARATWSPSWDAAA